VPANLVEKVRADQGQVDLIAERYEVRETVRRNLYTGKTYNSVENIRQFFAEKGMPAPRGLEAPPAAPKPATPALSRTAKKVRPGSTIEHAKYGRGTVLRLEGSGADAKVTVSFPGYGLKKLVAKYAGIEIE
jgi:DNA helicase-2/ATP-dependent DNA helicase PcrA